MLGACSCFAADYGVTAFGRHEIDQSTGKKIAAYSYKLENLSNEKNGISSFCIGDAGDEMSPLLDTRSSNVLPNGFTSPDGWKARDVWLEESYRYLIQWEIAELNDLIDGRYYLRSGQISDQFSVRLDKADPNYVSTKASVQGKQVLMIKADTVAPTAEIYLTTLPVAGKPDWLEVSVSAAAHDNMDPYPDVLLSKITANQTFPATDIQAVFNNENKKFLVKMAKNRVYKVQFKIMDASGNVRNYTKTLSSNTRRVHLMR